MSNKLKQLKQTIYFHSKQKRLGKVDNKFSISFFNPLCSLDMLQQIVNKCLVELMFIKALQNVFGVRIRRGKEFLKDRKTVESKVLYFLEKNI